MVHQNEPRELKEGFEPRLKARLSAGTLIGVLVGAVAGLLIGILVFERIGPIMGATLAGAIGGLIYGALVGSYASLESPNPGNEPSETAHPLEDPPIEEESEPGRRGPSA